jgi:hypothetical protein
MLSDKPLLSDDPIKLGLSQPSSMGALQSPDDDPFDDEQKKMLGGLGLTPEQMAGVGKLFGASKTSPNNDIRGKLLDEYTKGSNLTPKERVARVAYANGDLSGNPRDNSFAPKTQGAKFNGAQTDEERRASGANRLGPDLSGGQDPLRGKRL